LTRSHYREGQQFSLSSFIPRFFGFCIDPYQAREIAYPDSGAKDFPDTFIGNIFVVDPWGEKMTGFSV
jgi:hypothetical protein